MRHPNTAHATDGESASKKKGYALAAAAALFLAAGLTGCGDSGEQSENGQGGQSESPGQMQEQPPGGGGSGMQEQPPAGGGSGMQEPPQGERQPPGGGMQPPEEG